MGRALALLALLAPAGITAQEPAAVALSGIVRDESATPVSGVRISLNASGGSGTWTTLTDAQGRFQISGLLPDVYTLRTLRLGYVRAERVLELGAGERREIQIILRADTLRIAGVMVEVRAGDDRQRERFEQDVGVTARVIEAHHLRALPGLAEPDVLRAVQLLPGVISTSDFSSSFHVRGGAADQNLILLDGFTVFNPFHLGGLFSVFNADAVERAELFAGGFGAEFGGRVSSVLNVESRRADPNEVEVQGGISLLASRLLVHAPLPSRVGSVLGGEGGSAFISARRSYFDQLLRPIADFPYHLSDVQAHAGLPTRGGGRWFVTGYAGQDVLDLSQFGLSDSGEAADALRFRWNWGNRLIGTQLQQPIAPRWDLESRFGYSRFSERLAFPDFNDVRFESGIHQLVARADLIHTPSDALSLRFGASADRMKYDNLAEGGGTTFLKAAGEGFLTSTYLSLRTRGGSGWTMETGLRLDNWATEGARRSVLAPRLAIKRFLGSERNSAVKLAIGRYSQFLHSLRDEELPVSNDTWIAADNAVPPVISDQVQIGVESFWSGGWSASAEVYARVFEGVTELNTAEDPNVVGDDLLVGTGHSRGLDLQLRRTGAGLTGWASISLLRATRTMPDFQADQWSARPGTVTYPPVFDRRANVDLVLHYVTSTDLEVGARWNYGTGLPFTRPTAQHFSWRVDPLTGRLKAAQQGVEPGEVPLSVVLGPRNAERYPAYHRLDITVRRPITRSWGTIVPYLQVLNVYNRRNVLFYYFDYSRTPPVRSGFSMFPFLPAIGLEVSF